MTPYELHYNDDGEVARWDGQPDADGPDGVSSIRLLPDVVDRCMCARCTLTDPNGMLLARR